MHTNEDMEALRAAVAAGLEAGSITDAFLAQALDELRRMPQPGPPGGAAHEILEMVRRLLEQERERREARPAGH